ncbi:hypothetical protein PESP_a2387 [Pseudoalteromonas espejiana DSM 9414]|uniref:Uncharacterized protein n=1 Tax=Pseudoalteromonas espejiana TaxID=28107 RepID=A0A510XW85_9GAMM|nr:hypothetical protein PESP_a2387 [Pseudoalteromonas espejiana DSM 9414]GEK55272.1 hypothetical protein PES01_21170 [Pseudoalteromonas espejiana]
MQNTMMNVCYVAGWLALTISFLLIGFSKFKHARFKLKLFTFLNCILAYQVIFTVWQWFLNGNVTVNNQWLLLVAQALCSIICYLSVQRRKSKVRPNLDSFSMD